MANERLSGDRAIFLGDRVAELEFFGRSNLFRPSTDPNREIQVPVSFDESALRLCGQNEDEAGGWRGCLILEGGPLKLLYFIQLAERDSRDNGRVWEVEVEIPDFLDDRLRPKGIFELGFDQPLPGVVSEVD